MSATTSSGCTAGRCDSSDAVLSFPVRVMSSLVVPSSWCVENRELSVVGCGATLSSEVLQRWMVPVSLHEINARLPSVCNLVGARRLRFMRCPSLWEKNATCEAAPKSHHCRRYLHSPVLVGVSAIRKVEVSKTMAARTSIRDIVSYSCTCRKSFTGFLALSQRQVPRKTIPAIQVSCASSEVPTMVLRVGRPSGRH